MAGGKLKEMGFDHWEAPNTGATNEIGFTALPGGYVVPGDTCENLGWVGFYWTSTNFAGMHTQAWIWIITSSFPTMRKNNYRVDMAASIRCVKD